MDAETKRKIAALQAKILLLEGKEPKGAYKTDVKWYDENLVREYISSMPRSFYCALVGKQLKSLGDQFATYEIPVAPNAPVDVPGVLKWFHDFVTQWGPKIKKRQLIDERSAERLEAREALELKALEVKLEGLEKDLECKTGNAISSEEMEQVFAWYESELRRLGERLGKRFGKDAQELFNATLDRMQRRFLEDEQA